MQRKLTLFYFSGAPLRLSRIRSIIIYIRLPSGTINQCIQYLQRSTRMTDQYCFRIVQSSGNFIQRYRYHGDKSNVVISLVRLIQIIIMILYHFVFCVIQEYIALAKTILDSPMTRPILSQLEQYLKAIQYYINIY